MQQQQYQQQQQLPRQQQQHPGIAGPPLTVQLPRQETGPDLVLLWHLVGEWISRCLHPFSAVRHSLSAPAAELLLRSGQLQGYSQLTGYLASLTLVQQVQQQLLDTREQQQEE